MIFNLCFLLWVIWFTLQITIVSPSMIPSLLSRRGIFIKAVSLCLAAGQVFQNTLCLAVKIIFYKFQLTMSNCVYMAEY